MKKLKVLDLFSGIGGFSLGLKRTGGFETVAFCEIEPFCQKVLNKHWPNVPVYDDVRELTADRLARDGIRPDVITGGFPCQDISVAGKGAGIEGERSGLWSELARIIGEIQPSYAIMENVTNLISGDRGRWFGRVLGDLAEIGYDAEWHCIPASAIGAHHHRDRVWIIAYSKELFCYDSDHHSQDGETQEQEFRGCNCQDAANSHGKRLQERQLLKRISREARFNDDGENAPLDGGRFAVPELVRRFHGIPGRVDRIKSLGNAVVPQIPEIIGYAILNSESNSNGLSQGQDKGRAESSGKGLPGGVAGAGEEAC